MITKSEVQQTVYRALSEWGKLKRGELIENLFNLQFSSMKPVAPFEQEQQIDSKIISTVVDELISLHYLREENDEELSTTELEFPLQSSSELPKPEQIKKPQIPRVASGAHLRLKIGSRFYKAKLDATIRSRRWASLMPPRPEIGALFSFEFSKAGSKGIPLEVLGPTVTVLCKESTSYVFDDRIFSTMAEILRQLHSFSYQILKTQYVAERVQDALKLISISLLPYSVARYAAYCTQGHSNQKTYSNYLDVMSRRTEDHCQQKNCIYPLKIRAWLLNSEIFDLWFYGALMEWFASMVVHKLFPETYWHFHIEGEECDAMGFDEDRVIVVECKRPSSQRGASILEGAKKLEVLRNLLKDSGLQIMKLLFTTFENSKTEPSLEGFDGVVVTRDNFLEFVKRPESFF